jgi:hypothetical protein
MPPHCDSLDGPSYARPSRRSTRRTSRSCSPFAGEGAAFTGLKPAGLDVGPIIPIAEKAVDSGNPAGLEEALTAAVRTELAERFHHLPHLRAGAQSGLDGARAYLMAMSGLQVWAHGVYEPTKASAHGDTHTHS